MSPAELALANKGGRSFIDLCDDVRRAKVAHLRAIKAVDQAEATLSSAKKACDEAIDAEDLAMDALETFISRECAISEGQP
jgi:hypothetical protein